jgi:DNA-binding NarL/FixJ family response regulator
MTCHDVASMIRVLVVDDHPVLRAGLEAVLRAEPGFVCVGTAANGHEMLALVRRTRPDVVVLDRRLEHEDGLELCREVRTEPVAPEVLIYTADGDGTSRADVEAAGARAVVRKSSGVDDLFDAMRLAARGNGRAAAAEVRRDEGPFQSRPAAP